MMKSVFHVFLVFSLLYLPEKIGYWPFVFSRQYTRLNLSVQLLKIVVQLRSVMRYIVFVGDFCTKVR